jgi:hypothetical protein
MTKKMSTIGRTGANVSSSISGKMLEGKAQ